MDGDRRHYEQALEVVRLNIPPKAQDLVEHARLLFDAASNGYKNDHSILVPARFHDDVNATQAYWEWHGQASDNFERLAVNLVGNSLSFALEHRHLDTAHGTKMLAHEYPHSTLMLGAQKATIHAFKNDSLGRPEVPKSGDGVIREFRFRLNHAMATVGLKEYVLHLNKAS